VKTLQFVHQGAPPLNLLGPAMSYRQWIGSLGDIELVETMRDEIVETMRDTLDASIALARASNVNVNGEDRTQAIDRIAELASATRAEVGGLTDALLAAQLSTGQRKSRR
jgi:hypothetical protein